MSEFHKHTEPHYDQDEWSPIPDEVHFEDTSLLTTETTPDELSSDYTTPPEYSVDSQEVAPSSEKIDYSNVKKGVMLGSFGTIPAIQTAIMLNSFESGEPLIEHAFEHASSSTFIALGSAALSLVLAGKFAKDAYERRKAKKAAGEIAPQSTTSPEQ